jgi:predicted anti-sigma-YlaC factor YlaD
MTLSPQQPPQGGHTDAPPDWLDTLLNDETPVIPDDGFCAQVMQALPPRRQRRDVRTPVLLGSAVLAALLGVAWVPGGTLFADAILAALRFGQDPWHQAVPFTALALLAAFALCSAFWVSET